MAVAITRHFENMRVILSTFQKYFYDPSLPFQETLTNSYQNIFSDDQLNKYINLMSLQQSQEARKTN